MELVTNTDTKSNNTLIKKKINCNCFKKKNCEEKRAGEEEKKKKRGKELSCRNFTLLGIGKERRL